MRIAKIMSIIIAGFIEPPFELRASIVDGERLWSDCCRLHDSREHVTEPKMATVGAAMNRKTWSVRDNGFHTNVTRLVRGGIKDPREVLASCLGCYEVGLLMW